MAEEDEIKNEEKKEGEEVAKEVEQTDNESEQTNEQSFVGRFLPWIIMAVVIVVFAGGGFTLGKLFAGSQQPETIQQDQQESVQTADLRSSSGTQKSWYYDLDPVIANLNEPSVTRYVRATLTLELSGTIDQGKGGAFINEKKPMLTNWLTIYLAGQTLEDIRGDRNLRRIQAQILDAFNEKLFPNSKPQIESILFKEFAVQ